MHTSALAFELLRWAGVLYLSYLAVMTWRDREAFAISDQPRSSGRWQIVQRAAMCTCSIPS